LARDPGPRHGAALLLALLAALLLFRLGDVPLVGPDEPRYARVAVEMHRASEWVRPTLQGRPWLEKPVLYYWLAGAAYSVLGENAGAARIPSVLAALATVALTAYVGMRLYGPSAGLHAAFVLATSLLFFVYGRAASMDMLLAAGVTAAIGLLCLRLFSIERRWSLVAAWAAAGLATLAKGPLGLLLPMLVVIGFAAARRRWRTLRDVVSPAGVLAFLAVAGPWYVFILADQGRHFVDVFVLNHNVARFTSTVHRHPGPPWYYLPLLLAGFFPWSGLLLPGLARLAPRRSPADLFVLLWLAAPLAFFSLAGSKLPGYILPCLPPLALAAGRAATALTSGEELPRGAGPRAVSIVTLVLAAAVGALPLVLRRQGHPDWPLTVPLSVWAVLVALFFSWRMGRDTVGALRLLRVGAAGFLLLLAMAAPPIIEARESGASLFRPAGGREVLAWRAWRTAWMAGYFYNDGRVREVETLAEIAAAAAERPVLVVAGPRERDQIARVRGLRARILARGPRHHALVEVTSSSAPSAPSPSPTAPLR
jgi:4-amino-4-deoxy-L-arabinose transferase-like glycosyltransferase